MTVAEHVELDTLAKAALHFANSLRVIAGEDRKRKLAKGVPNSTGGCPVAATAGGAAHHRTYGAVNGWTVGRAGAQRHGPNGGVRDTVPVPSAVQDFMAAFDAGMFPDLIAGT